MVWSTNRISLDETGWFRIYHWFCIYIYCFCTRITIVKGLRLHLLCSWISLLCFLCICSWEHDNLSVFVYVHSLFIVTREYDISFHLFVHSNSILFIVVLITCIIYNLFYLFVRTVCTSNYNINYVRTQEYDILSACICYTIYVRMYIAKWYK